MTTVETGDEAKARLQASVARRLLPLSATAFREEAHIVLDAAEALLHHGHADLAEGLRLAVQTTVRIWAAQRGEIGAYAEALRERASAFEDWSGGRRGP